jgi:hypothetical protein
MIALNRLRIFILPPSFVKLPHHFHRCGRRSTLTFATEMPFLFVSVPEAKGALVYTYYPFA